MTDLNNIDSNTVDKAFEIYFGEDFQRASSNPDILRFEQPLKDLLTAYLNRDQEKFKKLAFEIKNTDPCYDFIYNKVNSLIEEFKKLATLSNDSIKKHTVKDFFEGFIELVEIRPWIHFKDVDKLYTGNYYVGSYYLPTIHHSKKHFNNGQQNVTINKTVYVNDDSRYKLNDNVDIAVFGFYLIAYFAFFGNKAARVTDVVSSLGLYLPSPFNFLVAAILAFFTFFGLYILFMLICLLVIYSFFWFIIYLKHLKD